MSVVIQACRGSKTGPLRPHLLGLGWIFVDELPGVGRLKRTLRAPCPSLDPGLPIPITSVRKEGTTLMNENFEGRKVVVVGGSSGMGLATAGRVVAGGGIAVLTGRDEDKVKAAVDALSQQGKAWGLAGELTARSQV